MDENIRITVEIIIYCALLIKLILICSSPMPPLRSFIFHSLRFISIVGFRWGLRLLLTETDLKPPKVAERSWGDN